MAGNSSIDRWRCLSVFLFFFVLSVMISGVSGADTIRLLNGNVIDGELVDYTEEQFTLQTAVGRKSFSYLEVKKYRSNVTYSRKKKKDLQYVKRMIRTSKEEVVKEERKAVLDQGGVDLFLTDWCPYCVKMERFLKKKGIPYNRYNIERSSRAKSEYNKIGGGGIPVVRVGDRIIRGYDPDAVVDALDR